MIDVLHCFIADTNAARSKVMCRGDKKSRGRCEFIGSSDDYHAVTRWLLECVVECCAAQSCRDWCRSRIYPFPSLSSRFLVKPFSDLRDTSFPQTSVWWRQYARINFSLELWNLPLLQDWGPRSGAKICWTEFSWASLPSAFGLWG